MELHLHQLIIRIVNQSISTSEFKMYSPNLIVLAWIWTPGPWTDIIPTCHPAPLRPGYNQFTCLDVHFIGEKEPKILYKGQHLGI